MNNGCIEFNQCNNRYGLQMENVEKLIAIVNRFYIISKNIIPLRRTCSAAGGFSVCNANAVCRYDA